MSERNKDSLHRSTIALVDAGISFSVKQYYESWNIEISEDLDARSMRAILDLDNSEVKVKFRGRYIELFGKFKKP